MTNALPDALALAGWLEATRGDDGFGGPVAHWWRDCLVDCRAGHDWRYEGIVAGYLALAAATADARWLVAARRAGDDLLAAQAPDGHYSRSQFEMNPGTAGTPHESGASIGLLRLAAALRSEDAEASRRYAAAAERNLRAQLAALWSDETTLCDHAERDSFVPNKACTFVEALLLLADLSGSAEWVERYAVPIGRAVLAHQLRRPGSRLDGAVAQNSVGRQIVPKYFPYYVARCVPGLLALGQRVGDDRFVDAALAAGRFVAASADRDGAWPLVLYEDGRLIRFPRWVAGAADAVRALELLRPLGLGADCGPARAWIAGGRLPNGSVRCADGFAGQGESARRPGPPDFRDLLPVAGWADKTLRLWAGDAERAASVTAAPPPTLASTPPARPLYLWGRARVRARSEEAPAQRGFGRQPPHVGAAGPGPDRVVPVTEPSGTFESDCTFLGRRLTLRLVGPAIELLQRRRTLYRWRPGHPWADLSEPWLATR